MDPRQEYQSYNPYAYQTINYPLLPPQQPSISTFLTAPYRPPILYPPQTANSYIPNHGYFNFASHQPDLFSARVSEEHSLYPSDPFGQGGVKRERAPDNYSTVRQGYEDSDFCSNWKRPRSEEEYPSTSLPRVRSAVHIRSPSPSRSFSPRKPLKQKRPSVLSRLQFRKSNWKRKPNKNEDQGSVSSQMSQTKKDESLELDISFESNVLCAREKLKSKDGEVDSTQTQEANKKDEADVAENRKENQGNETVSGKGNTVSFRIAKAGRTAVTKNRSQEDRGKGMVAGRGKVEAKAEKISSTNVAASVIEKKVEKTLVTKNRIRENQGKEMVADKGKSKVVSSCKTDLVDEKEKISGLSAACSSDMASKVAVSAIEKKTEKNLIAKNRSQENQCKEVFAEKGNTEVASTSENNSKDSGKGSKIASSVVGEKLTKNLVTKNKGQENQGEEMTADKDKIEVVSACKIDSKDKEEMGPVVPEAGSSCKRFKVAAAAIEKKFEKTQVTENRRDVNQEKEMVADKGNFEVASSCENDSKDEGEEISVVSADCSTGKDLNVAVSRTEKMMEKTVVTRSRSQGNQGKEIFAEKGKIEVGSASKTNSKGKVVKISAVSEASSKDKELNVAASRTEKKLENTVVTRSRSQENHMKQAVANKGKIEIASTGKKSSKNTMEKNSAVSEASGGGKDLNVATPRTGKKQEKTPVAKNRVQENQEKKTVSGKGKVEIVSTCKNDSKDKEEKIYGVLAACANENTFNVEENAAASTTEKKLERTIVAENRIQDNLVKEKDANNGKVEDAATCKDDSEDKKDKTKQVSKSEENVVASRTGKKLERTPVTKYRSQEDRVKETVANNCKNEVSSTSKNDLIDEEEKTKGVSADCSNKKVLNVGENVAASRTEEKLEKTLVTKNRKVADKGKIETVSTCKNSSEDKAEKMPAVPVTCSNKVETRSMIKKKLGEPLFTQNGIKENKGEDEVVDKGKSEVVSTCENSSKEKVELHIKESVATAANEKLGKPLITENSISEDQAREEVVDKGEKDVVSDCKDHSKDKEDEIHVVLVSSADEELEIVEAVELSKTEKNLEERLVSEKPSENPSVPMISDVEEEEILGKEFDRNVSDQLDSSNVAIQSGKKNLALKIPPLVSRNESNDSHEVQKPSCDTLPTLENSVEESSSFSLQALDFCELLQENNARATSSNFPINGYKFLEDSYKTLQNELNLARLNERKRYTCPVRGCKESGHRVLRPHLLVKSFSFKREIPKSIQQMYQRMLFSSGIQGHPRVLLKSVQEKRHDKKKKKMVDFSAEQKKWTWKRKEVDHSVSPSVVRNELSVLSKEQTLPVVSTKDSPTLTLNTTEETQNPNGNQESSPLPKEANVGRSGFPPISPINSHDFMQDLEKDASTLLKPKMLNPKPTLETGELSVPQDLSLDAKEPDHSSSSEEEGEISCDPIEGNNDRCLSTQEKISDEASRRTGTSVNPEATTSGTLDQFSSSEKEGQISCDSTNGNNDPCSITLDKLSAKASIKTGSFLKPEARNSATPDHLSLSREEEQMPCHPINGSDGPSSITLGKISDEASRRTGSLLDPKTGNSGISAEEPYHLSSSEEEGQILCEPINGNDGPCSVTLKKISDEAARNTVSLLDPKAGNSGILNKEPYHLSSSEEEGQIPCEPVNGNDGPYSITLEKIIDEASRRAGSLLDPEAEKSGTSAKEPYLLYSSEEEGQISCKPINGNDAPCPITLEKTSNEPSEIISSSLDQEAGNHGTSATPLEKHDKVEKEMKKSAILPPRRNSGVPDRLFAFGVKPKQATESNTNVISSVCSAPKETLTVRGIPGPNPTVPKMLPSHQASQLPGPFKSSRQNTWRRTESPLVPAAPLNAKQQSTSLLSRQPPRKWMKMPNSYVRKGNSLIRKSPNSNSAHAEKETEVKASLNSLSERSKTPPLLGNKPSSEHVKLEPLSLSKANEEKHIILPDNETSRVMVGSKDLATNPSKNERQTPAASLAPIVSNYRRIQNKLVRDSSSSVSGYSSKLASREVKKASASAFKSSRFSLVWTLDGKLPERRKVYSPLKRQEVLPYLFPWKRVAYFSNVFSRNPLSPLTRKLHRLRQKNFPAANQMVRRSLRWSKSMEKQSKKEAESAVKEHQKKKRKTISSFLSGKRRNGSQIISGSPILGDHHLLSQKQKLSPVGRPDIYRISGARIFRVGTLRYKMDPSRRKLVRIPDEEKTPASIRRPILKEKMPIVPRRLSIDNNEYIRVGNGNQLVRDPKKLVRILASEKVRWSLHTARLRSIRKQQYCQFFTRFGRCNKEQGKCSYIHDSTKVAICSKFLKGLCFEPDCKLTHEVIPERMPDCSYFLEGICSNSSCPYRHVNVNPKAPHCEGFLRGYCRDGNECRKKHSYKRSRNSSGKKMVMSRKRKRVETESFRSKGRYFGGPSDDSCFPAVSLQLEKKEKEEDIFFREGQFMEFISLSDDDDDDHNDDDDGSLLSKGLSIDRMFDDRDAIIKPIAIMR